MSQQHTTGGLDHGDGNNTMSEPHRKTTALLSSELHLPSGRLHQHNPVMDNMSMIFKPKTPNKGRPLKAAAITGITLFKRRMYTVVTSGSWTTCGRQQCSTAGCNPGRPRNTTVHTGVVVASRLDHQVAPLHHWQAASTHSQLSTTTLQPPWLNTRHQLGAAALCFVSTP